MKNDVKLLHQDIDFDVVEIKGLHGLMSKTMTISVLPYTLDDNGLIQKIGFLNEFNPFRENDTAKTLITGTVEKEDDDLIQTAFRELKEEGGIECPVSEFNRVIYLGNFYPYKNTDKIIPTFAINVTGLFQDKPDGDGSLKEKESSFNMIDISEALRTDELLPLGAILRLFNFFYSKITK